MDSTSAVQTVEAGEHSDMSEWIGDITHRLEQLESQLHELKEAVSVKVRELNNGPRFPRPGRRVPSNIRYSDEKPPA